MKNVIINSIVLAFVLGFCGISRGDEVADAAARLAEAKAKAAEVQAKAKADAAAKEAGRRAGRTYSEFAVENAKSALQVTKAGICATGSVMATADGYAGYVVAYPAVYVTTKAFDGGNAAWSAAASAWNAPVAK
jgi:hypothetical protein